MAVKIESNFLMMHNVVRKKNPLLKQTIYIVVPKYKPTYIGQKFALPRMIISILMLSWYYKNVRFSSGI